MTVTYVQEMFHASPFSMLRLLFRWRGSWIKYTYRDLIGFCLIFASISLVRHLILSEHQKKQFYMVQRLSKLYEKDFLMCVLLFLGFHTRFLYSYFWSHFCNVPWLITLGELILAYMPGTTDQDKIIRKTVMRYMLATNVLCYAKIQPAMQRIWSNLSMSVSQGLLTQEEADIIEGIRFDEAKPFIPLTWATNLITQAECEGSIKNHDGAVRIVSEIRKTYKSLVYLLWVDRVKIPKCYRMLISLMVYTQVAIMAISQQPGGDIFDYYFPCFAIVEITVLIGWLKISIILSRSMGENDDNFDLTEFLDYNWKVGNHIIDGNAVEHPELTKDLFFDTGIFSLNLEPKEKHYGSNFSLNLINSTIIQESKLTEITSVLKSADSFPEKATNSTDVVVELGASQQIALTLPTITELPEMAEADDISNCGTTVVARRREDRANATPPAEVVKRKSPDKDRPNI